MTGFGSPTNGTNNSLQASRNPLRDSMPCEVLKSLNARAPIKLGDRFQELLSEFVGVHLAPNGKLTDDEERAKDARIET
jgi:hypothetical protein